jgi:diguanylate cyclase (GGDEF)-like protein
MVAAALGADAGAVGAFPPLLIAPATLVVASAILSTALMQSDVDHRGEAFVDSLTGLLNGRALESRARELEQQSRWNLLPVALIVADIDGFKLVNDDGGHAAGDAVLKKVASVFRERLRAYDLTYRLKDGELAFRLGGDELLAMLPGATMAAAIKVAEDLRQRVSAELSDGTARPVTISCGVAGTYPGQPFDYKATFRRADQAMYAAKEQGRDRVGVAEAPSGELPHDRPMGRVIGAHPLCGMPAKTPDSRLLGE